jgi:2-polyprenyl-3-methyl-5-hydroxy-6-metoxy-1,4-benzoquinol methylase
MVMKDDTKKIDMDEIYRETPLEKIPWNVEAPPEALVELVRSGRVSPCKTVDLGCGAGNLAVYLAGLGFTVTGIDISPTAVNLARKNAEKKGVACDFIVADVLGDMPDVQGGFDFAYDWELLHHIYPEQREGYVANVQRLLNPGGKYLSVCFSELDTQFGGSGKFRKTSLGTILYFSSEYELREIFETRFAILELKTIEIYGKFANHLANYVFMELR